MKSGIIGALIGVIAIGGALGAFAANRTVETTADVELAVWRRVSDGAVFVSARAEGSGAEGWVSSEELDMSGLNPSGRFYLSNVVTVSVPVEVELPEAVPLEPSQPVGQEEVPGFTPVAGPCCVVLGMDDNPPVREGIVAEMQRVIDFALDTYGITHTGSIVINISYSTTGLLNRYEDAFGERPEELPDDCSFQRNQHLFFAPKCRTDSRAIALEWFQRAVGSLNVTPSWIGHGLFDYLVTHYVEGNPPTLTQDRFRRTIFYERVRNIRQDRASDTLETLAMLYAITDYGDFADWRRFYGSVYAGLDPAISFESIFSTSLEEFYADFEEWADHQKIILISTAFASCLEASQHIRTQLGSVGNERGYPDYRVPLEVDDDGDGIVCEGFIPPTRGPIQ
ncbi:MAG: hypothetical protein OXG61_08160 [Chloroflexi bacterium]|nr:hypothetical protein [Chloroflexota bacterium]